eukprot:7391233-Prymnesium_polylepis.2
MSQAHPKQRQQQQCQLQQQPRKPRKPRKPREQHLWQQQCHPPPQQQQHHHLQQRSPLLHRKGHGGSEPRTVSAEAGWVYDWVCMSVHERMHGQHAWPSVGSLGSMVGRSRVQ